MAAPLSARALAALGLGLSAVCLVISAISGFGFGDETWFLQVLDRVAAGDVLYRDVFFGSTPLSVWLGLPATAVLGSELLVVKAIVALSLGVTGAAVAAIARSAGVSARGSVALAVAAPLVAARYPFAPYTLLAVGTGLGAIAATAGAGRGGRAAVAVGALAGASIAAKYTVGFAAAAAVAGLLAAGAPRPSRRTVALVAAGAAGVVAASLLPVLLTGGWSRFLEYGFLAKGTYVEAGSLSYLDAARDALGQLADALRSPSRETLQAAIGALAVLSPVAAGVLAVVAWRRVPVLLPAILAAGVGLAAAVPRFEERHLIAALAGSVVLAGVAAHVLLRAPALRRLALGAGVAWVVVNGLGGLLPRGDDLRVSSLPHLRGIVIEAADERKLAREAAALKSEARRGPLLVVSGDAGLKYLTSGVPNATPFDYPYVTAFGKSGEAETAAAVRAGRFAAACVSDRTPERLRPRELEQAIEDTLRPLREIGSCTLYGD